MNLTLIGHIHSPFKDKFGTPRQSQIAKKSQTKIVFDQKMVPREMLAGLEVGSYIWVLFWFHLNNQKKKISKVRPPRLRGETLGVLATRSPHRPNPIGLSLGKIVALKKNELYLEGLDLVDQTPVIDIKPYLPGFDQPQDLAPSWIEQHPFPQLQVEFEEEIFKSLDKAEKQKLKDQLQEILCEDPRPLAYLSRPQHQYWLKYSNYDIGFEIKDEILRVKELKIIK